tara:strand:- start:1685 stop:2131 length:447 start_codon:yes stop_codon:yes gene_type:complete
MPFIEDFAFMIPILKSTLISISELHPAFLIGIFIVFVFIAIKMFNTFMKAIYIAVAAVAFPFVMNFGLGMNIPTDISNLVFFATTGIGIFFAYHIVRTIYKIVTKLSWVGGKMGGKSKKKPDKTPVPTPIQGPGLIETVEEELEEDLE